MAENNTPTGGAPAAPVTPPVDTTLPNVADRLSVPASALGLETELPKELQIPAKPDIGNTPAPTGPAAPTTPEPTPAAPTGPAPTAPAAPAPAPATGPAPVPEQKVKIGDKEYTTKELEALLAQKAQGNQAPPPAPAEPQAPPALTKEQVIEAEKTWCENFVKNEGVAFPATEADVETLLGGGKDAVAYFTKTLTDVAAKAVLLARKSIYAELNPQMAAFAKRVEPLFNNHVQVERVATEQAFLHKYPEFQGTQHLDTARQVAEAIVERYPTEVARMTQDQFLATIYTQTDKVLQEEYKRWNPSATDTWREAAKRNTASAPAPAAPAPAAPAPAPAPVAPPTIRPPAANSPASTPAGGANNWSKDVAKSLQD